MKFPGKKIILILAACLVAVAIILTVSRRTSEQSYTAEVKASPQVVVNEAIRAGSDKDTDGDGLKDWEEILWKMDPMSADTDGDGLSDNKEVENQKAAISSTPQGTITKIAMPLPENLTETDIFARDFFTTYAEYKKAGMVLSGNATEQQKIATSLLGNIVTEEKIPQFTIASIKISGDESQEAIRQYGNILGTILKNNSPQASELENEYLIFAQAIQNQNEKDLEKLDIIIKSYTNIVTEFSKVVVPQSAVSTHLSLINSLNAVLASNEGMRAYFSDPIKGLNGFTYYTKRVSDLSDSLIAMASYFNDKRVIFGEEEGGFVLVHSI